MQKKYKIILIVIVLLIISISALGISRAFVSKDKKPKIQNVTNVISGIDKFGYTLDNRDTSYMKDEFNNLTAILEKDEIDYEAYATSLAKLFVIDFYTLNNKINKYDVGSLEYVYAPKKADFEAKARDTIYNDIIDNTYLDRIQNLPEITNVEILSIEESEITLNENPTFAYKLTMNYEYKEDLGYDKSGTIYLIKNNEKLEVALYKPSIE